MMLHTLAPPESCAIFIGMTTETHQGEASEIRPTVIEWLLESDPSIRWQVLRDLTDEPATAVAAGRSRVAYEGWGARLLDFQAPDGHWGGATWLHPGWTSTSDTLNLLRELGLDPASNRARHAVSLIRENCDWGAEWDNSPFFEGEVEACINGRLLATGAYFGEGSDRLAERLVSEQLEDGGWNCYESKRSSFHSTICVLEGLLEYEKAKGAIAAVTEARQRGQEYLLERRLLRTLSTGEVINPHWTLLSFPTRWHYDILWGLDYMRRAGVEPDERMAEAIELVKSKRDEQGRWPLENTHAGPVHFEMEDGDDQPSRWITLRALRVLDWYSTKG